jgi:predicted GNAT superfamily acetyltransferase
MELCTLTTIDEFRQVSALEQQIWGYTTTEDAMPALILLVSSRIGGLVTGAFDRQRLVGFAYAMPGIRDGQPFQWSYMLGVEAGYRGAGLGWRLKLEQRRLVMASGLDLIKWTFDPLQALNAHLNFAKLGTIAREYHQDAYPDSSSALHAGTPTDRLVAEWCVRSGRVAERLDAVERGTVREPGGASGAACPAVAVNRVREGSEWVEPAGHDLSVDDPQVGVIIPTGFTEMQQRDLALAQAWRSVTRELFSALLARGYVVADFVLDRRARRGTYILERASPPTPGARPSGVRRAGADGCGRLTVPPHGCS